MPYTMNAILKPIEILSRQFQFDTCIYFELKKLIHIFLNLLFALNCRCFLHMNNDTWFDTMQHTQKRLYFPERTAADLFSDLNMEKNKKNLYISIVSVFRLQTTHRLQLYVFQISILIDIPKIPIEQKHIKANGTKIKNKFAPHH